MLEIVPRHSDQRELVSPIFDDRRREGESTAKACRPVAVHLAEHLEPEAFLVGELWGLVEFLDRRAFALALQQELDVTRLELAPPLEARSQFFAAASCASLRKFAWRAASSSMRS